jgi:flavin reductase (DIM6/NTAB) family NADH-FMN oxidoreductase RutF
MFTRSAKGLADIHGYYPMLATIVTAKSGRKENAMAVAWHAIVSTHPPTYGVSISPKRFTHMLISKSKRFAVNFMPSNEAELIAAVGGCSGRDVDKFKEFAIEKVKPLAIDVPILKRAYFAIECRLVSTLKCGDHDWFVGKVAATHWSDDAFTKGGLVRFGKARSTAYMGDNRYLVIAKGETIHLNRKECIARRKRKAAGKPQT